MAVFHYCARSRRPDGLVEVSDGVFDGDEPAADGKWLRNLRQSIAERFSTPMDPELVQITSLTRIGG